MRYRQRPIEIEAEQWFPGNEHQLVHVEESSGTMSFSGGVALSELKFSCLKNYYVITIHNSKWYLTPGDWIIAESDGVHAYPCKPDDFTRIYEPIS